MTEDNKHYVYLVTVDGVVRYVGSGKGKRYRHGSNGISSCRELNRDFFGGKNLEPKIVYRGLCKQESLLREAMLINSFSSEQLYNRQQPKKVITPFDATSDIFRKITITEEQAVVVLDLWFDRDFKNVAKIFREVYAVADKTNKETDWDTAMPISTGYINQFKNAVNFSTNPKVIQTRNSKYFDMNIATAKGLTFYGRLKVMKEIFEIEEEFLALQQEALDAKQETLGAIEDTKRWKEKVFHLLGWEIEAEDMLLAGKKQVEVCLRFSKSASTVKRLVKRLKEEGVL
jgi:hypothetical protein